MTKKSNGKRGGQAGNKNALKHGFYARHFSAEERGDLDKANTPDLSSEIALARVAARRVYKAFMSTDDPEMMAKILDALTEANTRLATLLKTDKYLRGEGESLSDALASVLKEINDE